MSCRRSNSALVAAFNDRLAEVIREASEDSLVERGNDPVLADEYEWEVEENVVIDWICKRLIIND
jgi:hypothetical protein